MRFSPTPSEINMMNDLSSEELLHYAATRMNECEEAWGLGNDDGWSVQERDGQSYICIWPYHQLADEFRGEAHTDLTPSSISLEHFVYDMLSQCNSEGIMVEVCPLPNKAGMLVSAQNLFNLLEGMIESGEYYIEG